MSLRAEMESLTPSDPSLSPPRREETNPQSQSRSPPLSTPQRIMFVNNPLRQLPASTDVYPCAKWFDGPTPIPYLRRYEEYVIDVIDASQRGCCYCGTITCWRNVPHVELPDFCDDSTLSAMKRYAARDTKEFLRFVRLFATFSFLCDRCECDSCEMRADDEYSAITSRANRPRGLLVPLPEYITWYVTKSDSCRSVTMPGTDDDAIDSNQCEVHYTLIYNRVIRVQSKIRLWHTSNFGAALSRLLPTLAIDEHRTAIVDTFIRLMRLGAVSIAIFFGLYANANLNVGVGYELHEFMIAHRKDELDRCECGSDFISCVRNFKDVVPRSCQRAYLALAMARGFRLGECREGWWMDCLRELDVRKLVIELNAILGMDEPVRGTIYPQLYVDGSVQRLERLAARSYLRLFGMGPPRAGSLPPRLHAVVEWLGERIVEYCRSVLFG